MHERLLCVALSLTMLTKLTDDISGYDVCIIGAGPAGLTIATELAYTGLHICVLESGGERRAAFTDALKTAESTHLRIKHNSRERVFGGASTVWGGLSAPLDAIDLESRPWSSGWPIAHDEMVRYWSAAERYRFPKPSAFDMSAVRSGFAVTQLREKLFLAVRPPFNFASLRAVFHRANVDVYLQATVTRLLSEWRAGKRVITEARCRTAAGKEVTVRAAMFVLAAGGIENPRLLLVSAIGDEHDQVGRYFMNHPKGYAGRLLLHKPLAASCPYLPRSQDGRMVYAGLALPESRQRTDQLLNSYVQLEPDSALLARYALSIWRRLPAFAAPLFNLLRPRTVRLRWYADMEPRPENRITLGAARDAYGTPLPVVSYALGERDEATLEALHQTLCMEVTRLHLGRVEGTAEEVLAAVVDDASHHLGGTRMGSDSRTAVVDADCRVYGTTNCYVAGGSLFPTSGSANPTYTIVALAIRLAEHLKREFAVVSASGRSVSDNREGVIIIGAGKRIAQDVLPALESLRERCVILGVYARHAGEVFGTQQPYSVAPLAELSAELLSRARFVYVAIPPQALATVLAQLPQPCHDSELIIDTPVPWSPALRWQLRRWSRVHVAEDSVFLPWLALFRGASIGRVVCDRSVYRYHGVALLTALCGGAVRWALRFGSMSKLRVGTTSVDSIEPRDYAYGTLTIDGIQPELMVTEGRCVGFRYQDRLVTLAPEESALAGYMEETDTLVSRMMELKRVGLRRLMLAALDGHATWSYAQGRRDARVDYLLHRVCVYVSSALFR